VSSKRNVNKIDRNRKSNVAFQICYFFITFGVGYLTTLSVSTLYTVVSFPYNKSTIKEISFGN
jgi:hypothetical protein